MDGSCRSHPPYESDLLLWTGKTYDPTTHQIKSRISPQYNLTLKQGLCAGMTTLSEIAFDDLSGVTITDYGTDTATIAISGNKITCSVAGNIYYIELSNGAYLVPVATKFYDVSGNAFAPIGDSLIDFTARSDDALFWCDERGFAVTEENEILPALVAGGGYAPSGYEMVRITATTTGSSENVILNRIKLSEDSIIFWGDGESTALTGNTTYNNLTHTYTVAGSYQVKIAKADKVKEFWLGNNKWSNFTSYDLRNADIDYFQLTATGSGFTVDTSHMTGWTVGSTWYLYSMPAGNYNINSSHMTGWTVGGSWTLNLMPAGNYNINSSHMTGWTIGNSWNLYSMPAGNYNINSSHMTGWTVGVTLSLYSMPAGTYNIDTSHMTGWTVGNSWNLYSMPAGNYNINSSHMTGWTIGNSWNLYSMPAGNYNINSSHMTGWTVGVTLSLRSMPAGTYNLGTTPIRNWTSVDRINLYDLIDETTETNMMTEAEVIKVIEDIYAGRLTFTHTAPILNIAGTNASLTDAGARLKVDHLRAGNDGVNTFRSWTINVNGYPA
jgi:D-alanyl-D-alanine dipeptidase